MSERTNTGGSHIAITVNGEERSVKPSLTVASLLQELDVRGDSVAVELNGRIVRRDDWDSTVVEPHSRLEVVQFVGGG